MARQFQFVTVSNPTEPAWTEARKSIHSHVMRQAHAKKRRLQTQRYQNESVICGTKQDLTIFKSVLSSPLSQVFTNSKDPFSSLARSLTSDEYFLLDHCMFIVAMPDCLPGHHLVILIFSIDFSSAIHWIPSVPLFLIRSQISRSSCRIRLVIAACSTTRETTGHRCFEIGLASPSPTMLLWSRLFSSVHVATFCWTNRIIQSSLAWLYSISRYAFVHCARRSVPNRPQLMP